jgi:UDP-N-acetyl-D-mannosaminuronic acid transferase (WecB/TagA/CpsF family)
MSLILGINFFDDDVREAVNTMCTKGGLLVAPSGTCFARLQRDPDYRRAVTSADLALADSGFMVTLWRLLRGQRIRRISGLAYLKRLVNEPAVRLSGATFWILPNAAAREKVLAWATTQGFQINPDECYLAPFYGPAVADETVVALIDAGRPRHIVIGIGAGAQEKLGYFLWEEAGYRPAIHCIGGALGILTGDQKPIPDWADRFYLGWLLRLFANPRVFIPRLWNARQLPWLIMRYGERLPPIKK